MRDLIFKQLYYSNENRKLLESLMIPYNKEFDEHENRDTSVITINKVTDSMLAKQESQ